MKNLSFLFLIAVIFSLFSPGASAHGLGKSFSKEVSNFTVEFEYESLEVIGGELTPYVFRLLEKDSGKPASFDSVFVRFEDSEGSTYLAARLGKDQIQEGAVGAVLTLNEGSYTVNLSFQKDEENLAETSFDLKVVAGENPKSVPVNLPSAFILGGITSFLIIKFLEKLKDDE
jgi:hypothetical protein